MVAVSISVVNVSVQWSSDTGSDRIRSKMYTWKMRQHKEFIIGKLHKGFGKLVKKEFCLSKLIC